MAEYKCLASQFEDLQKKINRIGKKLNANNLKWRFEKISEQVEEIQIMDCTNPNNISTSQFHPKYHKINVATVIYQFEMETLKLGNYIVIAVLDHTPDGDQNLVYTLTEGVTIPEHYRTAKGICEHCNINRQRNKTVILQDMTTNELKQVGTSCIKEYTGIDAEQVIRGMESISIVITDAQEMREFGNEDMHLHTIDYLANCIHLINQKGYKKEIKIVAFDTKMEPFQSDYKKAEIIIEYFKNHEEFSFISEEFLHNTQILLNQRYINKPNGFVAYAPLTYEKLIQKDKQIESNQTKSNHQGNINEKLNLTLTHTKINQFEGVYGTTYIHTFEDVKGNVYIWKTGSWSVKPEQVGKSYSIKGTVKAHTEWNGLKQTELTRCKLETV
jgi:hypothetical protein